MTTKKVQKKTLPNKVTATITREKVGTPTKTYHYTVEEGITIMGKRREFNNVFPFEQMKVGDSFLIPKEDHLAKNPNGIHYGCKQYARDVKPGFMVTTRKLMDGSRRVWRIK